MRHPVFVGMRKDKPAPEVEKEEIVSAKEMADLPPITHPTKIYFPEDKITKQDLVDYYDKMAETILPYLKDRAENLHRYPDGIYGQEFYQKDNHDLPKWVKTKKIFSESNDADINYLVCQDKKTLLYLINLGCIELNPWNSKINRLEHPDYVILDLDPEDISFKNVVKVAQEIKKILEELDIKAYPKTSGATGIHIFIPTGGKYNYDQVKQFAELLATITHQRTKSITSVERSPAKRQKKVYIDFLQNRFGQTIAAPYSVRPRKGATVSTPLKWDEVNETLDPHDYTIKTIFKRLEKYGDLWAPVLEGGLDMEKSLQKLAKINEE